MDLHWALELQRYLSIKTLFVLHGNVHDLFPKLNANGSRPASGAPNFSLLAFLRDMFWQSGYDVFATFDLVDGLRVEKAPGGSALSPTYPAIPPSSSDLPAVAAFIRAASANASTRTCTVIDFARLLLGHPDSLSERERPAWLQLFKAAMHAARVDNSGASLNNAIVLIAEKLNDLPPWLYLSNPFVKTIEVPLPTDLARRRFFEVRHNSLFGRTGKPVDADIVQRLADLTHGLSVRDLESLLLLSQTERIDAGECAALVQLYKFGVKQSPWSLLLQDERQRARLRDARSLLEESVKGQGAAIDSVIDILKRAALGLSGSQHASKPDRPKGVLFFAGPTGVGKTELAKAVARLVFGDTNACIRFDMSEYSLEHADQRFFGAPPGYVGYEQGGELTNKVRARPFSVLLFDEIEKAHPKILDKFLQILDDGRMTSGQGETVYFSEALIIFTSNKGIYEDAHDDHGGRTRRLTIRPESWRCSACGEFAGGASDGPCPRSECGSTEGAIVRTPYDAIQRQVRASLRAYFTHELERPELYNRIGNNFIVFDFIRADVAGQIVRRMLADITADIGKRHSLHVDFSAIEDELIAAASSDLNMGARGIGNLIETRVLNPLGRRLFESADAGGTERHWKVTALRRDAACLHEQFVLEVEPRSSV